MNNKIFTIYKISFPNGKVYIGLTYHYHLRIKEHLNEMKHSDYKLYRAMRKYNINENNFSIVEENILTLNDADNEVNKFYKSDRRTRRGILHANSRNLSDEEVLNIRIRYFVNGEKEDDIFKKYKHLYSKSGFNKILFGLSYMHVKMPIKTDKCKLKLPLLSKEEVISLREQYNNGKSINELKVGKYEKYSMNNFRNLLIGRTYKNY